MTRNRPAFTLVELLTVIAIIALLAGMLLAVAGVMRGRGKEAQTRGIIAIVLQAVEAHRIDKGGAPSACEHPLAGTAPPAAVFQRADGTSIASNALRPMIHGPTAAAQVDAACRDQLALPDDRFADPSVPLLYGLSRQRCTVLGPVASGVTWRHQVSPPQQGSGIAASQLDPAGPGYPRIGSLQGGTTFATQAGRDQTRTIDYLLGAGGFEAELARLGGLRAPPDDDPAKLIRHQRVWSDASIGGPEAKVPTLADGTPYLLRGKNLYDAFGHELLYCVVQGGAIQVLSAGRDGGFVTRAGPDGVLGTADDLAASADNIVLPQGGGL